MALTSIFEFLPENGTPEQLFILLHGENAALEGLEALATALRVAFPQGAILAPMDTDTKGLWYPTQGLTDDTYPQHVDAAMPALSAFVQAAQARFGLTAAQTALAGFSQGAVMALQGSLPAYELAARVLAFGGRFASLPKTINNACTLHWLHGADDLVIPVQHAVAAQAWLTTLDGDSTIDVASNVGHEIHPLLIARAVERLQTCVPLRSWKAALGLDQSAPVGVTLH